MYPYYFLDFLAPRFYRLISLFGFFVFLGLIAGLYFLIIWKMKPKFRSGFNALLTVIIFLAGAVFIFDLTTSLITIVQVNRQLGFSYATPHTNEGEIFQLQRVRKGKTMDKAGLKPWDRILMNNVNDFYRLLIANQGKTVTIPVLRENKKMEIKVHVPPMNVPLQQVSFLTF